MPDVRRLAVLAVVCALALLAGCTGGSSPRNEGGFVGGEPSLTRIPPEDRVPAPVVSGTALDGTTPVSTADLDGRVVVLNVWGSWCKPCRKEAPDLQAASAATRDVATFVGLNTRDTDRAQAAAFNRRFGVTYPSIYDPTGQVLVGLVEQVPPRAIPTTLVIDAQGRVAARITNAVTKTTLVGLIQDVADGR